MLLVGGATEAPLRVALVTTHLPLREVPAALTRESVRETLAIVARELSARFGIAAPRIAVCGLNPHAGEGGHLGLRGNRDHHPRDRGCTRAGTRRHRPVARRHRLRARQVAQRFDAVVAMYHDQGLPVLKAASFGHGVNVTLGLPFMRTSVDHGTALDLARDPVLARTADPGSMFAAVDLAIELAGTDIPPDAR